MGNLTNDSEKARQAAIIAQTGTKVPGEDKVTRFDRFTAFVAGTDCQNIHPNGHITADNAELCGIDRAVTILAELDGKGIDPEAAEVATIVVIGTFDRFWCGKDEHPFGHGTVATAKHGSNRTNVRKAQKAAITVKRPAPAQTTQSASKKDGPAKLRSGSQGNTKAA